MPPETSLGIRNLKFTTPERKRLIDRLNKAVDTMRQLDRHINNLRKKIEPNADEPEYLLTVYGVGYKLRKEKIHENS